VSRTEEAGDARGDIAGTRLSLPFREDNFAVASFRTRAFAAGLFLAAALAFELAGIKKECG
jgi:hypothetical protein